MGIPGCGLGYPGNAVRGGPEYLHCTQLCDLEGLGWEMGTNVNNFTQAAPSSTSPRENTETACSSEEVQLRRHKSAIFAQKVATAHRQTFTENAGKIHAY